MYNQKTYNQKICCQKLFMQIINKEITHHVNKRTKMMVRASKISYILTIRQILIVVILTLIRCRTRDKVCRDICRVRIVLNFGVMSAAYHICPSEENFEYDKFILINNHIFSKEATIMWENYVFLLFHQTIQPQISIVSVISYKVLSYIALQILNPKLINYFPISVRSI